MGIESFEPDRSLAPSPLTGEGWGGGGAPLGSGNSKKCANALKGRDRIREHLTVLHAEYAKLLCRNPPIALVVAIPGGWTFVRATIDLDDDATLEARKIDDERPDWNLTAKLVAGDLALAEQPPKDALTFCRFPAELSRTLVCHRFSPEAHTPHPDPPPQGGREKGKEDPGRMIQPNISAVDCPSFLKLLFHPIGATRASLAFSLTRLTKRVHEMIMRSWFPSPIMSMPSCALT